MALTTSRSQLIGRIFFLGFIVLVYIFLLTPLVVVVIASFDSAEILSFPIEGFSLQWYRKFLSAEGVWLDSIVLSLKIAVLATIISTTLGTAVSLYVVRFAGKWRESLRIFIILPLLLPEILTAIALLIFYYNIEGFFNAMGVPLLSGVFRHSFFGLLVGHVLITLPFVFLGISGSLYNFDMSLEEASRNLGGGRFITFWRITLPIVKPGIIAGALLALIISYDLFAISYLLKPIGTATLPIQLFDYVRWEFDPTAAAVSTVSIVFTLVVLIITERLVGLRALRF
jgi:putative spermidine/putrescine transport system permease protein